MAEDNLKGSEDKIDAGFRRLETRLDTLDTGFRGVIARLDSVDGRLNTLDTGLAVVRTDLGDLKAHVDEVRDALLADNAKNREFVAIKVEALRSELKVYADGVISHSGKLENHETRITKLETR